MSLRDLLHEAFRALESNRGRSLLTILGIVIGIGSVIAMTALIGGIQNNLVGTLGLNAARSVMISSLDTLSQSDIDKLKHALPIFESIEGAPSTDVQISVDGKTRDALVMGCSEAFEQTKGYDKLESGEAFTDTDDKTAARVCTIDRNGLKYFFKGNAQDAIGKTITVGNKSYRVVGVRAEAVYGEYTTVVIPKGTFADDYPALADNMNECIGLLPEGADVDSALEKTKKQYTRVMGVSESDVEDNMLVYSQKVEVDALNQYMSAFQIIMGSVASISLLVGGIGIMNMMLTNVTERIREIGIRRALGATGHDITSQFLAESAALCLSGGVIGIIMGYIVSWVLSVAASSSGLLSSMGGEASAGLTPDFSIATVALAFGISILIGIVFGYYPARRAAKLDPVECLRYQ